MSSKVSTPAPSRRLNLRGLAAFGLVLLAAACGFFALKAYRDRRATPALLAHARKYWAEHEPASPSGT